MFQLLYVLLAILCVLRGVSKLLRARRLRADGKASLASIAQKGRP